MITVKEIEELFRNEEYEKASQQIRMDLMTNENDAELLYYLFLAENGDYANIDLDDIKNEIHFNKAISLAVLRLRSEFTAEYNFYKAVDKKLRKYFCFASRRNYSAFGSYLLSTGIEETSLIHDGSTIEEFLSNLDYIVTTRVNPLVVDMNLLALNILYLATKNEKVVQVYNVLLSRAKDIGTKLSSSELLNSFAEIQQAFLKLESDDKNKNAAIQQLAQSLSIYSSDNANTTLENQKEEIAKLEAQKKKLEEENAKLAREVSNTNSTSTVVASKNKNTNEMNAYYDKCSRKATLRVFLAAVFLTLNAIQMIRFTNEFFVWSTILTLIFIFGGIFFSASGIRNAKKGKRADRKNGAKPKFVISIILLALNLEFSAIMLIFRIYWWYVINK